MVHNAATYEQAVEFRRRGFTYSEIAKICGVSKSTVANWLSKQKFSQAVANDNSEKAARENKRRMQLLNKSRKAERKLLYQEAERTAETEYRHYKHNPLFIAGVTLYMSEGARGDSAKMRITSSQVRVHQIFTRFAREFLGVPKDKLRFWLLLYPDHAPETVSRYWSRKIGIPLSQFHKYQVIQGGGSTRTLQYGTGNTIIVSTVLKRKLNKWIELATKELTK